MKKLSIVLCLALALFACKHSTIATVASDLHKSTSAMSSIQNAVIAANKTVPPGIDSATAVKLMSVCLRVDQGTQQSLNLTRNLNALGPADQQNLTAIISPVLNAINASASDPAIAGIKNANTRAEIQLGLAALQTAWTSINALVKAGQ